MRSHRIFSSRSRPVHYGSYPLHRLARVPGPANIAGCGATRISFSRPERPHSIVNAMAEHQAMMDTIRDGLVNGARAEIPEDPAARANHIKSFGYFCDASMVGIGRLDAGAWLDAPVENPDVVALARMISTRQTKTLASGIDLIMADLKDQVEAPQRETGHHDSVIAFLVEYYRDPGADEPGAAWIQDAQSQRACLLAAEVAVVIAQYMRLLGFDAKAHTGTDSNLSLDAAAILAGLAVNEKGRAIAPYLGARFAVAAVTTDMKLAHDRPLALLADQPASELRGVNWKLGRHSAKSAFNRDPFRKRDYVSGSMPMERIRRVDAPTTYMDEPNIPRVPKRTDMFARSQFGDMGKANQDAASTGLYARKSAPSSAQRRALGAFVLLQDGPVGEGGGDDAGDNHAGNKDAGTPPRGVRDANAANESEVDADWNASQIKATCHFLGVDAVGVSRCPEWSWYSHDARGDAVTPPHDQAISMVIDQGFETMEGASGDDWISVAQSMRAYLRFSLLGGVVAKQIRNLGYPAKAHTVLDGDVLQPPLLLLGGLGEVSRIGEVILHPFLGPRLKSGVVTTTMPLSHDRPIDFGMQNFCNNCQKCARECPSGAITAGPKLMFNGYEIWKSDSQKCTTYRITTKGGAMCGRCMKTCPWNLEGLFAEAPFRWAASHLPWAARFLARLDDLAGRGGLNDTKKWWWDIELAEDGAFRAASHPVNRRGISPGLRLAYEEQTLAVYPAPLAPHPYPYPFAMDREAGIRAYGELVSAREHRARLAAGERAHLHRYTNDGGGGARSNGDDAQSPVIQAVVKSASGLTERIAKFEFAAIDGAALPAWEAGAHIDVLVAPGLMRQYSMSGNPGNRDVYQVAVLREEEGRGGSVLMHRIFTPGRRVFISRPINHFALRPGAGTSYLMGGGIGITPMMAFAHALHDRGAAFEMHYSVSRARDLGFLDDMKAAPWFDRVRLHVSGEGGRADLVSIFTGAGRDDQVYVCGPEGYMEAVASAAGQAGITEGNLHREYFAVPEQPDYENFPFELLLARSGARVGVGAGQSAADALVEKGYHVDLKCSDGLCGVCRCGVLSGEVEHRDFVLSNAQRRDAIILCQSRAAKKNGVVEIDM